MAEHSHSGARDDCPLCCRARLLGTLSPDPAISHRTLAALAAGLVAVSAAAPAATRAQEPDQVQEGVVETDRPDGQDREAPDFDPGGDTALPFDVGPPPATPEDTSPDGGPIETDPIEDAEALLAPLSEPPTPETGRLGDAPRPPAAGPAPVEGAPPAAPPAPGFPIEPAPPAADLAPVTQDLGSEPGARDRERASPPNLRLERPVETPARSRAPARAAWQARAAQPEEAATARAAPPEAGEAAPTDTSRDQDRPTPARGGGVHVVQPGESLWTIAQAALGPDASSVRIAREVARLWMLNHDRIATGDPDMIIVGTRLRLR